MKKNIDFKLRKWKISDIEDLVKYANNKKISDNLTNAFPNPYTKKDGIKFIKSLEKHNPTKIFAIIINNKACGSIGIFQQSDIHFKNAEIGYWLAEEFWGNGIITAAIIQIVEYGFNKFDITRIYARPFGTNTASQKVLKKAGFKLEVTLKNTIIKNGEIKDELIYAIYK